MGWASIRKIKEIPLVGKGFQLNDLDKFFLNILKFLNESNELKHLEIKVIKKGLVF